MNDFLKGTYKLDVKEERKKNKLSDSEEKANKFRERALASIGGSMECFGVVLVMHHCIPLKY